MAISLRDKTTGGTAFKHEAVASWLPFGMGRDCFLGLILVLAVVLAYQPVWHAGFIWDDDAHVTANPCIVGPLGLKEIWTTRAARICPLVLTTFWVEHKLWGLAPLPYHLVNVFMHAAGAVALWRVLRRLQVPGAWLGAALWALHPVQVETVAWITELKNTQSGLFYLLSILFFVRWLKSEADGGKEDRWSYALTLLFAALAMASKSSTVVLPVVLCLVAWWVEGRWQWRNLKRVGPVFLMSVAAAAVSMWTQALDIANDPLPSRSLAERLATAGDVAWFYLGKLLWPHPLIFIYPRWDIDPGRLVSYLPLLALLVVMGALWLGRRTWSRPYFFALAYFLAALLPVLGLVDHFFLRYSFVGDHFQYLASMGPLALAGAGLARLSDVIPGRPSLPWTAGAGLMMILGLLSWRQAWIYESSETLWTATLAHNPDCWMAYNNLGNGLFQKGQLDGAVAYYQKALATKTDLVETELNLGSALFQKGQMDEAIAHFQKALEIKPDNAAAHMDLGVALFQKGRINEAIIEYQKGLKIDPAMAEAHYNLGNALLHNGQTDEAIAQYQQALEIRPDYAKARNYLGLALLKKGDADDAMAQFRAALEIDPALAEGHYNLGNVLLHLRRFDEAVAEYQQALQLDPSLAKAHNNLGIALSQMGRMEEAIVQFQDALQVDPNYGDAQRNLSVAQVQAKTRSKAASGK